MIKQCENCKNEFQIKPSKIALGRGRFCSRSCRVRWRAKNVKYKKSDKKKCPRCKRLKPYRDFYKRKKFCIPSQEYNYLCKPCLSKKQKEKYDLRKTTPEHRERMKDYYQNVVRVKRQEEKIKVMNHYGNKCNCCNESNFKFLTIDHVNGDGYKQRKLDTRVDLCKWIIQNNYPPTFQLLCWNCNSGRYFNKGICPHKD